MTNTELTLDQLKGINGGFLLAFALLAGCGDKDDKKTWIDKMSEVAICESGESHPHPIYTDANCPKPDKK